eukprot:COSAG02_NODE_1103_length_14561_cov_2.692435_6_plen_201_part_00
MRARGPSPCNAVAGAVARGGSDRRRERTRHARAAPRAERRRRRPGGSLSTSSSVRSARAARLPRSGQTGSTSVKYLGVRIIAVGGRMPGTLLLLGALVLSLCGGALARQKGSPQQLQQEFSKLVKDADDAIHEKRNSEAVKMLSDALDIMDGAGAQFAEGDVRFNRATALKALERYEEAIADYEVTIRVNPKGARRRVCP